MYTAKATIATLLDRPKGKLSGSIYLPTHPESTSQNMDADRTRFRNALQALRRHANSDDKVLGMTLAKLEKLYEDIDFWKHRDLGLAILFDAEIIEHFKLPFEVTEAVYLTDHFVVSPLLIMDAVDMSFYLLDINLTQPRLFYGTHGTLKEVNKDAMPGSLDDEVGKSEYKKQLQHQHGGPLAFHGHTEEDAIDDQERRYLRLVAEAVDAHVAGKNISLLLAGTSNRTSGVRKELKHPFVIEQSYSGNVERLSVNQLYEAAIRLVTEHFDERRHATIERLKEAAPQFIVAGKDKIIDIATTDKGGKIDSLYLPIYRLTRDSVRPGDNTSVVIDLPEDIEQIESVVTSVARQGGAIVPVEIDRYDFLDRPKALCRY